MPNRKRRAFESEPKAKGGRSPFWHMKRQKERELESRTAPGKEEHLGGVPEELVVKPEVKPEAKPEPVKGPEPETKPVAPSVPEPTPVSKTQKKTISVFPPKRGPKK